MANGLYLYINVLLYLEIEVEATGFDEIFSSNVVYNHYYITPVPFLDIPLTWSVRPI